MAHDPAPARLAHATHEGASPVLHPPDVPCGDIAVAAKGPDHFDIGRRVFDVRSEFPDAWQRLEEGPGRDEKPRKLVFPLARQLFPYLPGQRDVRLTRIELMIEPDTPCPGMDVPAHRRVSVVVPTPRGCQYAPDDPCLTRSFECVSSADWPGLLHGGLAVDVSLPRLTGRDPVRFLVPKTLGRLRRLFVICEYEAETPEGCERPAIREWVGRTHDAEAAAAPG